MSALAFDLGHDDGVPEAPRFGRRLYAVRGSVGEPLPVPAATLDAVLGSAWSALAAGSPATCPVCASTLQPRWSAGAGITGGRCDGCGSTLD